MARDCTVKKDPNGFLGSSSPPGSASGGLGMGMGMGAMSGGGKAFDSEYASLMAELGEGGDSGGKGWGGRGDGGGMGDSGLGMGLGGSGGIPPWRRPDVWQQQQAPPQNNPGGYRPPQAMGGYGGAPYPGAPAAGYAGGSGYGPNGQWVGYPQAGASGYGTQQAGGYDPAAYAQYYQGLYQQQQTAAPQ
jgi:splicing factor 1